jgi:hypothetical protein
MSTQDHSQNAPQPTSAGQGSRIPGPASVTITDVKVIPHPRFPGHWAILVDGHLYGKFDRRALAIAYAVTRV